MGQDCESDTGKSSACLIVGQNTRCNRPLPQRPGIPKIPTRFQTRPRVFSRFRREIHDGSARVSMAYSRSHSEGLYRAQYGDKATIRGASKQAKAANWHSARNMLHTSLPFSVSHNRSELSRVCQEPLTRYEKYQINCSNLQKRPGPSLL